MSISTRADISELTSAFQESKTYLAVQTFFIFLQIAFCDSSHHQEPDSKLVIEMELQLIQNKIYEIRGERVMIDRDLAEIYGVETRALNQAVKRNSERFPSDFMFQLSDIEFQSWKSQIVMSNAVNMGLRKKPFVFTELGVAMLSSVLNSKTAIQININIMRAFVAVRNMLPISPADRVSELQAELQSLKDYIEEVFTDYNDINEDTRLQIELINQSLAELHIDKKQNSKHRNKIGY